MDRKQKRRSGQELNPVERAAYFHEHFQEMLVKQAKARTAQLGRGRTKSLFVRMCPDDRQEVDAYCRRTGKSLRAVVEAALLQFVRGNKEEPAETQIIRGNSKD